VGVWKERKLDKMIFNFDNIDKNVYIRDGDTKRLIHRDVAYKEIYLKNREKYPLPFSEYQVHHLDGNKFNNSIKNLLILTREEHKKIHNIRFDKIMQRDIDKIIENLRKLDEKEIKKMFESFKK